MEDWRKGPSDEVLLEALVYLLQCEPKRPLMLPPELPEIEEGDRHRNPDAQANA